MDTVMAVWIGSLVAAFCAGFLFGMLAMALFSISKESDRNAEQMDIGAGPDTGGARTDGGPGWQRRQ